MMISSVKLSLAALSFLVLAGAAPTAASEWTRGTVHGGQVTRSVAGDGRLSSAQTTRVGPNGGTYTSRSTCVNGIVGRCHRSYSAVGANGRTYSGHRATARGPFRVRSIGAITGPQGNVAVGARRHWR